MAKKILSSNSVSASEKQKPMVAKPAKSEAVKSEKKPHLKETEVVIYEKSGWPSKIPKRKSGDKRTTIINIKTKKGGK